MNNDFVLDFFFILTTLYLIFIKYGIVEGTGGLFAMMNKFHHFIIVAVILIAVLYYWLQNSPLTNN